MLCSILGLFQSLFLAELEHKGVPGVDLEWVAQVCQADFMIRGVVPLPFCQQTLPSCQNGGVYPVFILFPTPKVLNRISPFSCSIEMNQYWFLNHPTQGSIRGHPFLYLRLEPDSMGPGQKILIRVWSFFCCLGQPPPCLEKNFPKSQIFNFFYLWVRKLNG